LFDAWSSLSQKGVPVDDLGTIMRQRKSIRAFKSDPVPKETIGEILKLSILAPSSINLQPSEFHVVMGGEKERLIRRLLKAYRERQVFCGPGTGKPLPRAFAKRGAGTLEGMKPYFEEMKAEPSRFINEGSCQFYGAPVAVLLFRDDSFSKGSLVDIGISLGYFVLAAHSAGLGTCPIGLINAYADEVKDLLNIPENKNLVVGVALGYPDWESPINHFKSSREPLDQFVRWLE